MILRSTHTCALTEGIKMTLNLARTDEPIELMIIGKCVFALHSPLMR